MNAIRDIFVGKSNQEAILNAKRIRFFNELREICAQIKCTDMWFEMEEDEDLIDASIYQRESLNARYRYLLRQAKENNISVAQH
ncbi:uncharacterized protein BN706_00874 [Clostridium sp. CAG:557]|jgi:hypothetical protein|nr:uncharacterized protein BN706_00874 [Clostridium sp. CAG:557]